MKVGALAGAALVAAALPIGAAAQSAEALAKQLANPVASLISVAFQLDYGETDGPARESVPRRAASPDTGPHGWGFRLVVTLLFPK